MTVKRIKPQTLREAIKNSIQEECIRIGESDKENMHKPTKPVFDLGEDSKGAFERGCYQRGKKLWLRREQIGGQCNNDRKRADPRDNTPPVEWPAGIKVLKKKPWT